MYVLRQRVWQLGIKPREFWAENSGASRLTALESVVASTEENREHNEPFLASKGTWFRRGYYALTSGLVVLIGSTLWHVR